MTASGEASVSSAVAIPSTHDIAVSTHDIAGAIAAEGL